MDQVPRRELVVVEDSTLAGLAASDAVVQEFPFLAALRGVAGRPARGCGGCAANRAARQRALVAGGVKRTLAGLDGDRKRRFKELLNAHKVRVVYTNTSGKVVSLTF